MGRRQRKFLDSVDSEATALSRTRPEARAELGAALLGMRRHFRCSLDHFAV